MHFLWMPVHLWTSSMLRDVPRTLASICLWRPLPSMTPPQLPLVRLRPVHILFWAAVRTDMTSFPRLIFSSLCLFLPFCLRPGHPCSRPHALACPHKTCLPNFPQDQLFALFRATRSFTWVRFAFLRELLTWAYFFRSLIGGSGLDSSGGPRPFVNF